MCGNVGTGRCRCLNRNSVGTLSGKSMRRKKKTPHNGHIYTNKQSEGTQHLHNFMTHRINKSVGGVK